MDGRYSMHNAQSWPSKLSVPKGFDVVSMGYILLTMVTPVPRKEPEHVGNLHVCMLISKRNDNMFYVASVPLKLL